MGLSSLGLVVLAASTVLEFPLENGLAGRVTLEDPSAVFSAGRVEVLDARKTVLARVEADELTVERDVARQPWVALTDFDFDGVADVAVMNGQHGCSHGPSFSILLTRGRRLVLNEALTELHDGACFVGVDARARTLTRASKSGCCWHDERTFTFRRGVLEEVSSVVIDAFTPPFEVTKTTTAAGTTVHRRLDVSAIEPRAEFTLENGKVVWLYVREGELHYALVNRAGHVELDYPHDDVMASGRFEPTKRGLTFSTSAARYEVDFEAPAVVVTQGERVVTLRAKPGTKPLSPAEVLRGAPGNVGPP
jgi:hypothetical protein